MDRGSHFWLASSSHLRIVFVLRSPPSEHILFLSPDVPGGTRSTATAAGQRATASSVRPNPASDAAVLLAPPLGKGPQSGFEEHRRCPMAPDLSPAPTLWACPAAVSEFLACVEGSSARMHVQISKLKPRTYINNTKKVTTTTYPLLLPSTKHFNGYP
jgi:hypothetical protein